MLKEKEHLLLSNLRQNSRESLVKISSKTNIPISTLFDVLKRLEANVIKKHFSIVDFAKLGYSIRVNFVLKTKNKKEISKFLMKHPSVNSASSLINNYDFYVDCFFRNLKESTDFKSNLENIGITEMKEMFIIDEIKREGFSFTPK